MQHNGLSDQRSLKDRRKRPTTVAGRRRDTGGRRERIRRSSERGRCLIVDVYSPWLWAAILTLIVLSLVDGCLTLLLITSSAAKEINPIMSFYLESGPGIFVSTKYFFTAMSVILFLLLKDLAITKVALASAIMMYLSVVIYELNLLLKNLPSGF